MDFNNMSAEIPPPAEVPVNQESSTGAKLMATMNPAQFDSLIKVLAVLEKQDSIIIKNSMICQSVSPGSTILSCNIAGVIGPDVNMHILSPRKAIKLFKAIKGNAAIAIYDDDEQKRYIITNGAIKVFLPKQATELTEDMSTPDMSAYNNVGKSLPISKEHRASISSVLNECDYSELLIHNGQFKGVYVPETAVYLFEEYAKEPIDETTADVNLKAYSFLGIDAESYEIIVCQKDDTYWMMTRANTGFLVVDMYESIQVVTDESFLI